MLTPIPPAYSIGKSNYPAFKREIPGPGEYNLSQVMKSSAQSYSFSKSPRKIHDYYEIPGPGVYNPNYSMKSPGYSLSRSPRQLSNVRTYSPGPGDYSYQFVQKRYQYSISKARTRSYNFSESPGPGYYSPSSTVSLQSSPKIKFPKQTRMPRGTFLTPSPGQYNLPNSNNGPVFSIPKATPKPQSTYSPGPGVYEIPTTIGVAGKKNKL